MAEGEISETGFRARAGLLTLMYLTSAVGRPVLLAMLAEANAEEGADLGLDDDEVDDEEFDEEDVHEGALYEDEELEDGDGDVIEIDPSLVARAGRTMKVTSEGRQALFVGGVLERWLGSCPERPMRIGGEDASLALAALVLGWSTTVVHALAERPLTLSELSGAVESVPPQSLKERAELLQRTGLVRGRPGLNGEVRYVVTDWLREAIAPLAAAARMEHRYPTADAAPVDALDVETALLLTPPLLELPRDLADQLNGSCRLGVEVQDGGTTRLTGVTVRIESGRVTSCTLGLDEQSDAWATASAEDWMDTVIEPDAKRVRTGGDRMLASVLLNGLHRRLFGVGRSAPPPR